MTTLNARWELGLHIESKRQLSVVGRNLDYNDEKRIQKLQEFLDSQNEPEKIPQEQLEEIKQEFKNSTIPF